MHENPRDFTLLVEVCYGFHRLLVIFFNRKPFTISTSGSIASILSGKIRIDRIGTSLPKRVHFHCKNGYFSEIFRTVPSWASLLLRRIRFFSFLGLSTVHH